ncbi:anthranilate synthase family protein [Phaeacidiphilus oryzae]|uniref:anthranilate synthase family protein n=1 Tax=Phaeacidiphilus oryzae TaxID=348818 RepID=UPI0005611C92|nr:anthranilate synthase family protein [Phaeacidiphilus oryzae]
MPASASDAGSLLRRLASGEAGPFALLHRRTPRLAPETVEVLLGPVGTYQTLAELPVSEEGGSGRPEHDLLALVPYRQIRERGFPARHDGTPLRALRVEESYALPVGEALGALAEVAPERPVELRGAGFRTDDDAYAAIVERVLSEEIGRGEGANFVIRRDFTGVLPEFAEHSAELALLLFGRLLRQERGAYWTFLVHTGDRVLVGASPEVHVRQTAGTVVMNPISGTYRYPAAGPDLGSLLAFLSDPKEREELSMVVDEELKMMCAVGDLGGQVLGPRLKEMSRLAHTEYELRGRTSLDVREVLRQTMFAATVTGSPLQNATRVINRHEPDGRGYYAGALALIGRTAGGEQTLDSPILIRTADIDAASGRLRVGVGATLVRKSDPRSEVAETHAKAAGVLRALGATTTTDGTRDGAAAGGAAAGGTAPAADGRPRLADDHRVQSALDARRADLAPFWLRMQTELRPESRLPADAPHALVVDCEDTFTTMLAHLLRSLGNRVTVLPCSDPELERKVTEHQGTLVLGPGPGDPADAEDPRMRVMRRIVGRLRAAGRTDVLAVCLSHQLVCAELGLPVRRKAVPFQGAQETVDLFGERRTVGFYNTFAAVCDEAAAERLRGQGVEVARDPETGEVHGLRGPGFATLQFHPESVLTTQGVEIVAAALAHARAGAGAPRVGG